MVEIRIFVFFLLEHWGNGDFCVALFSFYMQWGFAKNHNFSGSLQWQLDLTRFSNNYSYKEYFCIILAEILKSVRLY